MNRRIFFQLSGPAAIIGVLLLAASLGAAWSIHRLQTNLSSIIADNVSSLEAAQSLEVYLRQLRFHSFMQVLDPRPERLELVDADEQGFEVALRVAIKNVSVEKEDELVKQIETGYRKYRKEIAENLPPANSKLSDYVAWSDMHPVRQLQKPCQELLEVNKVMMEQTALESEEVGRQTRAAILFVGILGPISGLIVGYGVSRAWSRSIARVSLSLQDMHAHLDKDVGAIKLQFGKDWPAIEGQLDHVVARVKEAAQQLQRQQEEILRGEQLAAVGQLAAGIAHEIRNPLTAIKILVGIALRPEAPQALTPQDLTVIYEEIGKLEHTVQTLLDFAKPSTIQQRDADLLPVMTQAVNLVRPRADQQGVKVTLREPEGEIPASIDPGQVGNVFLNLLLNSLDAMPQGGEIEIACGNGNSEFVSVTVSDNGPGISAEMEPKLFRPFASTKLTGTGLGLSISSRIVREHGGTLEYEARPEGGSRFIMKLPRISREAAHAAITGHR